MSRFAKWCFEKDRFKFSLSGKVVFKGNDETFDVSSSIFNNVCGCNFYVFNEMNSTTLNTIKGPL